MVVFCLIYLSPKCLLLINLVEIEGNDPVKMIEDCLEKLWGKRKVEIASNFPGLPPEHHNSFVSLTISSLSLVL